MPYDAEPTEPTQPKPLIGISVCIDRGERIRTGADYYYVRRAYAEQLRSAGAEPVLLSLDTSPERSVALCDGFVVTGGDDLPRSLADGVANSKWPEDQERISWDRALLSAIDAEQKPVLGICYGMQLINLHYGGSLYEQVLDEHSGAVDHGGGGRITEHELVVRLGARLLMGLPRVLRVNSSHRQAVQRVAPGFSVMATASDGVIEAIERELCFGVEWHPETDPSGPRIYERFVELVGQDRARRDAG